MGGRVDRLDVDNIESINEDDEDGDGEISNVFSALTTMATQLQEIEADSDVEYTVEALDSDLNRYIGDEEVFQDIP